jgi:hypothetical protein
VRPSTSALRTSLVGSLRGERDLPEMARPSFWRYARPRFASTSSFLGAANLNYLIPDEGFNQIQIAENAARGRATTG